MVLKAILFDLDGTLLDSSLQVVDAYYQGMVRLGKTVEKGLIIRQAGKSTSETGRALGLDESEIPQLDQYFWDFFGKYARDPLQKVTAFPGAKQILSTLQSRGVKLGLVTSNTEENARLLLEKTNLLPYMTTIVGKESCTLLKPHPEPIHLALNRLGLEYWTTEEVWYVGDTASDVAAGRAAGVMTFGLLHEHSRETLLQAHPDVVLDDLEHFLRILKPCAVVLDFDGTITTEDVSERVLREFAGGDWEAIEDLARKGKITMEECIIKQYSLLEGKIEDWLRCGREIEVRSGFNSFLHWANRLRLKLLCVSAGLSFIIDDFKHRYQWNFDYVSPKTEATEGGIVVSTVEFDHKYPDFKVHQVRKLQEQGYQVIYIGDGGSDSEAIRDADIRICVKNSTLSKLLGKEKVVFYEFEGFEELPSLLEDLLGNTLWFQPE